MVHALNFSQDGKDFICQLLVLNQSERLSAEDCLNHPWISKTIQEHDKKKENASIRWHKYGHAVKALNRFRGIEKKM